MDRARLAFGIGLALAVALVVVAVSYGAPRSGPATAPVPEDREVGSAGADDISERSRAAGAARRVPIDVDADGPSRNGAHRESTVTQQPVRTGDLDTDLRNFARWQVQTNPHLIGLYEVYPTPGVEALIENARLNPERKELDREWSAALTDLAEECSKPVREAVRKRLDDQLHAMLRSIDSGAFTTFSNDEEFTRFVRDMNATYGKEHDDWLSAQMIFPGDWGGRTMVVYVTRQNEPALFQAQDRYFAALSRAEERYRQFFARAPN